jgi:hypothetical protein
MDAMNVDPMEKWQFSAKYGLDIYRQNHREVTSKEIEDAYEEYKKFFYKYHSDHSAAITDCYKEFLKTIGKQQATHVYWE